MTEDRKEYMKFTFRWGSIIGFVTFMWYVTGFFTGWERMLYFNDLYFIADVLLIGYMIISYKKEHIEEQLKFSKIMSMGFYSALIVALFYAVYFLLRITKLDPLFFQVYMNNVTQVMKTGFNADYSQILTPQTMPLFKGAFVFSMYITSFISSMIYTLFLAAIISLNRKIYGR